MLARQQVRGVCIRTTTDFSTSSSPGLSETRIVSRAMRGGPGGVVPIMTDALFMSTAHTPRIISPFASRPSYIVHAR